jgi:hypothetical protein
MPARTKFLQLLMSGQADANIAFSDLCSLLEWLGFQVRVRGSHRKRNELARISDDYLLER